MHIDSSMSFNAVDSFVVGFYSYCSPLEPFILILEYNLNLNFLASTNYRTSVNLYEYTTKAYNTTILFTGIYKDLFSLSTSIDNIFSSTWYTSFLDYLDRPMLLTREASILDNSFITLTHTREQDTNLVNGSWVLKNMEVIEAAMTMTQKLLQAFSLIYLFLIVYLLISSTYNTFRKDSVDHDHFLCAGSIQSEKELGNLDDLVNILLILAFVFGSYINQSACISLMSCLIKPEVMFSGFILFILTLFLNLSLLLVDLGSLFMIFIKGASRKQSFLYELFLDILFIFSYFIRTLIQNVRVIVTFIFYFSYIHALEDQFPEVYATPLSPSIRDITDPTLFNYQLLKDFFFNGVHLVYEAVHFSVIFLSQLGSFLLIVFWIFNSLYFAYENNRSEQYFIHQRNEFRKKWFPGSAHLYV